MLVVGLDTPCVCPRLGGCGLLGGTNMASLGWGTPGQGMLSLGWWPYPKEGMLLPWGNSCWNETSSILHWHLMFPGVVIGGRLSWQTKRNEIILVTAVFQSLSMISTLWSYLFCGLSVGTAQSSNSQSQFWICLSRSIPWKSKKYFCSIQSGSSSFKSNCQFWVFLLTVILHDM